MENILICEDSQEGIFTGIYAAYEWKCDPEVTILQVGEEENLRLFASYRHVAPDGIKAEKVARTIRRRFGEECYEQICYALSSWEKDKGQAVYRTVAEGLSGRVKGVLLDHLSNDYVRRTFELSRGAGNEAHHLLGFLRFMETEEGILYGEIGPKNHVLPFLMPHFADRFPGENFVIRDKGRNVYGIHPARGQSASGGPARENPASLELVCENPAAGNPGREHLASLDRGRENPASGDMAQMHSTAGDPARGQGPDAQGEWFLFSTDQGPDQTELTFSGNEEQIQELFRHFCRKIMIKERKNEELQRQMLPLRFQEYMMEFVENDKKTKG